MHEKWCHAFTKNVFSVGLLSIQNGEDASHIVRNLSSETMTLTEIACRCEQATKKMCTEEFREDMLCEKNKVNLKTRSPMEKEAERFYTRTIFKMFQEEFIDSLTLAVEEINSTETLRMFQLIEKGSTKTQTLSSRKAQTVKFDPSDLTLACSCGKFESVGILCVHALKVLIFMNIFKIPSRYLVKRWTKSAKDSLPVDIPSAWTARDGVPINSFMGEFMRKALHVAHMSVNKKRKRIAMRFIDLAVEHIAKVLKTEEVAVALDDPDGKADMDWTICEYALETQLDQQSAAKSGMGCPRGKRKVQGHRPAGKRVSLFLTKSFLKFTALCVHFHIRMHYLSRIIFPYSNYYYRLDFKVRCGSVGYKGGNYCLDLNITCLEIESDASHVIYALQKAGVDIPDLHSILNERRDVLAELQQVTIKRMRSGNQISVRKASKDEIDGILLYVSTFN
ncbi:hypothetical protein NL676_019363 [Syzygium grande]|nr:hypothetical protein NL676_019363 [Syzygium grande]